MIQILTLLSSALLLTPTLGAVYTGFNYGAFWGEVAKVKTENDFRKGFKLAQDLTTGTQFNSARLFTCKQQGTTDTPTDAFEAAVKTKTNLLLGFWVTPGNKGEDIQTFIDQELSALAKGFKKHGQALSDLVIGLSVGSEDVYRFEDTDKSGVSAKDISSAITIVKEAMKTDIFAQYMKDKPIGHVDTAKHVVVEGADFYGMTAYPYWNQEAVAKSKESFLGSLDNVKQRAGNTPIWIAEMGWPYDGPQRGEATTGKDSLQNFWTNVGCEVIGKYNTFWFELIMDAEEGQPDFGVLNPDTHKPRIDLSCPGLSSPNGSTTASSAPIAAPTTLSTIPSSSVAPVVASSSLVNNSTSTVRVTTTIVVTVHPSGAASTLKRSSFGSFTNSLARACLKTTPAPEPTLPSNLPSTEVPWCVTVADIAWNGQYVPVAANPAGPDGSCSPPPTYTGLPYGSNRAAASPSVTSPAAVSPTSSIVSFATPPASTPEAPVASSAAPVVSSSAAPIVPSSPAPSAPASSPVVSPSGSPGHPHCKRKASTLGGYAATYEPARSSFVTLPSSATLPDFSPVTSSPATRKDKRIGGGSLKRWVWRW